MGFEYKFHHAGLEGTFGIATIRSSLLKLSFAGRMRTRWKFIPCGQKKRQFVRYKLSMVQEVPLIPHSFVVELAMCIVSCKCRLEKG